MADKIPAYIKALEPKRVYCRPGETYTEGRVRYLLKLCAYKDVLLIHRIQCLNGKKRRFMQAYAGMTAVEAAEAMFTEL